MRALDIDKRFGAAVAEMYDQLLVPLIFQPYADDMARRVASHRPARVLEIAAGTGVVTRQLAAVLPASVAIVATDLNPPMLDRAIATGTARPVEWRQADAMQLPFADATFDVVACQFGVMFFPDKAKAFAQARRVLAPGGVLLFSVWDPIEDNEFADAVTAALASVFPDDPPRFMARTPHGYCDRATIAHDLAAAGFNAMPCFDTVTAKSRAESAHVVAVAYCQGTPLRNEIESRDPARLAEATSVAEAAVARRFGRQPGEGRAVGAPAGEGGPVEGRIQAQVVSIQR